jgi:hypothetical protein
VVVRANAVRNIPEDWEVVSKSVKRHWIATILGNVVLGLLLDSLPMIFSDVTWTVRQKSTGTIRRVTADSESQAAVMITKGYFDAN